MIVKQLAVPRGRTNPFPCSFHVDGTPIVAGAGTPSPTVLLLLVLVLMMLLQQQPLLRCSDRNAGRRVPRNAPPGLLAQLSRGRKTWYRDGQATSCLPA